MNTVKPLLAGSILAIAFMYVIAFTIFKANEPHTCKWNLCPYKGITPDEYRTSVAVYVNGYGTDAYYLDSLHLEYPTAEYEELETKLETIK